MKDRLRKMLYLVGFATMISSLWALAEAKNLEAVAARSYWPAKDPAFFDKVMHQLDSEVQVETVQVELR